MEMSPIHKASAALIPEMSPARACARAGNKWPLSEPNQSTHSHMSHQEQGTEQDLSLSLQSCSAPQLQEPSPALGAPAGKGGPELSPGMLSSQPVQPAQSQRGPQAAAVLWLPWAVGHHSHPPGRKVSKRHRFLMPICPSEARTLFVYL